MSKDVLMDGQDQSFTLEALPDRPPVSDSPADWVTSKQMRVGSQDRQLPESVWELKPAWCQPWSILMTGVAIPLAAYNISGGSTLLAVLFAVPVSMWWYAFLVIYPAGYREYRASLGTTQSMDEDDGWTGGQM